MIIVTGAAGFIGSALIKKLNDTGRTDILAVDRLADDSKWKNLRNLKFSDYIETGTLESLESLLTDDRLKKASAILHMGACSSTTETDMSFLVRNNFEYTKLLALHATRHNIRFIYASSAATYGDGGQGYSDDESRSDSLQPLNPYGYSKQLFDQWAWNNGLLKRIAGMKYFNVYGPNEYHKKDMRSMIMKAYEQAVSAGRVKLFKSYRPEYADGEQVRDFIYVKDAVAMTLFFMEKSGVNGLFNIGTGKAESWNTLARAVFKALDKPDNIEYIEMPENIRAQYQYHTQADISKIRKAGYTSPVTGLTDGVTDYVRHYLKPGLYLQDRIFPQT
jgi:ADP-L-glycero-D-manno-heptose 6-epimerase